MLKHINIELLSVYLDGRVDAARKSLIEGHIAGCPSCREKFLSLKASRDLMKNLSQIKESEGFDFEFRRRLNEEMARRGASKAPLVNIEHLFEGVRRAILSPAPVLIKVSAVVTLLAFLTGTIFWGQIGVAPAIASVCGEVEIYNVKTGELRVVREGLRLNPGDVVNVGINSQVKIESGKYGIMLKENTQLIALKTEQPFKKTRDISYKLDKGKMLVATKKSFKGSNFRVESPTADIKVKGTGFLVDVPVSQKGGTWVGVLEGRVEVDSRIRLAKGTSKVFVEAGKATQIRKGSAPTSPRYLLASEWEDVQEVYRIGEDPQVALLVSMTPRRVYELLRPAGIYISDKKSKAISRGIVGIINNMNEAVKNRGREGHLQAVNNLKNLIVAHPGREYNIQFMFFIAAYYYYLDEHRQAIDMLDNIVKEYPASGLVSLAECAKGIIYERELKNNSEAALSYKTILAGYPNSLEAKEALSGLKRLGVKYRSRLP